MIKKLFDKIRIIEPFPAIYIDDLDLIVIADLHLGYETAATEEGMFIPKIQYKKIVGDINDIYGHIRASRILINGDVKHEFSETGYHEYHEVSSFFDYLKNIFETVIVIKGNHDNFINRITKKHNINLYKEFKEGDFYFTHGHQDINLSDIKEKNLVLAHEHPSLGLYSDINVKEKMKSFLYGKIHDKNLLVLPAFSYFAQGIDVNLVTKTELLSPLLRKIDIDAFKAIGIIEGEKCLPFPSIRQMRELYERQ
ncbi:MAG: metallophosphoesterase [Candidatus Thermoplasmatota archaeon]|nr:metallophosphoesterase [Candidatus Thermoplasmatota archaeon]